MTYADKASLLAGGQFPEDDVDVPGVGIVRVRGLNRAELMQVQQVEGLAAAERKIIVFGMVEPKMTEAEVGQWQKACLATGAIEAISTRIAQLSGMSKDSAKEAVKEFEANPDLEFPVLPGAEVGDAGR